MVFFNSLTPEVCSWEFGRPENERYYHKEWRHWVQGITHQRPWDGHRCRIYIFEEVIHPPRQNPEKDAEIFKGFAEPLLHEMLPAFILIYACTCKTYLKNYPYQAGANYHGLCWQTVSFHIEKFMLRYLGINMNLGRGDVNMGEKGEEIPAHMIEVLVLDRATIEATRRNNEEENLGQEYDEKINKDYEPDSEENDSEGSVMSSESF